MIVILDYGLGNLGSIKNMLKHIGAESNISRDIKEIHQANKLILPGVGAFDKAMSKINKLGLKNILLDRASEGIPILGICLGMQLLLDSSEEGKLPGLGLIPGEVKKFNAENNLKVPHMGWNDVEIVQDNNLTKNLLPHSRFYFVHSYFAKVRNASHSMMQTNYGHVFDSAISNQNIFGVQFHPEKSHKYGIKLLENFSNV